MEIRGKTVLLTGATGGLGQAIARRLHAEGATLTLTGRREDVLEPLVSEVDGRALGEGGPDPGHRVGHVDLGLVVHDGAHDRLGRLVGADRIARDLAEGNKDKR